MSKQTRDPVAERLDEIESYTQDGMCLLPSKDVRVLLSFARDVLKITDPDTGRILADAALDDIRDAAARHLGGEQ